MNRLCACGCGSPVPDPLVRRNVKYWRRYVDVSHRDRACYARIQADPERSARTKARHAAYHAAAKARSAK